MVDRKLLRQALSELVILKNRGHDPSRFLGQLDASALEEWAERLSVDPFRLNKLVLAKVMIASYHLREVPHQPPAD